MYTSIDSKIFKTIKISESHQKHAKPIIEHRIWVELQRDLQNHITFQKTNRQNHKTFQNT